MCKAAPRVVDSKEVQQHQVSGICRSFKAGVLNTWSEVGPTTEKVVSFDSDNGRIVMNDDLSAALNISVVADFVAKFPNCGTDHVNDLAGEGVVPLAGEITSVNVTIIQMIGTGRKFRVIVFLERTYFPKTTS